MSLKYKADLTEYINAGIALKDMKRLNRGVSRVIDGHFPKNTYNAWQIERYIDDARAKLAARIRKETPAGYAQLSDEEKWDIIMGE